ncbi:MAG: glutamyl-tRNA reductase [Prolixibacteraceae bacterium]
MIGVIGLSHKSAPVDIREKFSLSNEENIKLARQISASPHIDELVLLSTCNRTEIYFKAANCCSSGAFSIIHRSLGIDNETTDYFYRYQHDEAVRHLFRVVSSLDSMVLGEYQIVSQVKEAFHLAKENKTIGKIFKRLFSKALETGKLVRTRTAMSTGAFSVSYAAVEKCSKEFANLKQKKILLVGAGETGELVIKNLHKKGCQYITVTNRTAAKAEELARRYQGTSLPFSKLMQGVHEAEIIVSSVSCKHPLIDTKRLMPYLNGHPRMMIDLGVPRNIHPDISAIPGISLLNVDDLEEVVAGNQEKKQTYVSIAEAIIDEKVSEFSDWLSVLDLSPAIQNIISAINQINSNELAILKKSVSPEEYPELEKYSRHTSEKLVNSLIKRLKVISNNGRATEYVKVVSDLFSSVQER